LTPKHCDALARLIAQNTFCCCLTVRAPSASECPLRTRTRAMCQFCLLSLARGRRNRAWIDRQSLSCCSLLFAEQMRLARFVIAKSGNKPNPMGAWLRAAACWLRAVRAVGGNSTAPTKIRAGEPLTYGVFQPLGVTLPVNDCATILPSRTTNVSVPISYTLSTVSALHRM
jgi:hypothetical protein